MPPWHGEWHVVHWDNRDWAALTTRFERQNAGQSLRGRHERGRGAGSSSGALLSGLLQLAAQGVALVGDRRGSIFLTLHELQHSLRAIRRQPR